MKQPDGFLVEGKQDYMCRLRKNLYGLKQAPRQWLKKQLGESFVMKDLGVAKQILGIRIIRESKERKLWLSQEHYIKRVLQRF